jgi:expansin (peptidoglycan-binding protein)
MANNINANVSVNINIVNNLFATLPTIYQQTITPTAFLGNVLTAQQLVLTGLFNVSFPVGEAFCGMIYVRNLGTTPNTPVTVTIAFSDTNNGAFPLGPQAFVLYFNPQVGQSGLVFPTAMSFIPANTPCPLEYALVSNANL